MHIQSERFTPECPNALGRFAERHFQKDRQLTMAWLKGARTPTGMGDQAQEPGYPHQVQADMFLPIVYSI